LSSNTDDTAPQYKSAIIKALQESEPSELTDEEKINWEPIEHQLLLDVLAKFNNTSDDTFPLEFCRLIRERADNNWPENIIDKLILFATTHEDPKPNKLSIGNPDQSFDADKATPSKLESNTINCVRGVATHTIAQLLWEHESLFEKFKPVILQLANDEHPTVRTACIHLLLPVINIDKNFAVELFIKATQNDLRIASTHSATNFFNYCMQSHYKQLYPLVLSMHNSDIEEIIEQASQEIIARWIFHGYFSNELEPCITGSTLQRKAAASVISALIHKSSYFEKCKLLINRLLNDGDKDIRHEISRLNSSELFSSKKGREFLIDFIKSNTFKDDPTFLIHDIEKFSGSILPFSDILITIGEQLFEITLEGENSDIYHDTHLYFPLIVRLYEQACDSNQTDIETQQLWTESP